MREAESKPSSLANPGRDRVRADRNGSAAHRDGTVGEGGALSASSEVRRRRLGLRGVSLLTGWRRGDLAEWNASLTKRMNRFLEAMRRGEASPMVGGRRRPVAFDYLQGRELQERGALHVHAVLIPRGRAPLQFDRKALRELAMRHGFGHELKLERIGTSRHGGSKAKSPGRVAGYVSKYVSKAANERGKAPWASLPRRRQAPYRTWTRSRGWPRSMKEVRDEQRRWARVAAGGRRS